MDASTGALWLVWTVRLAVACYVVRLLHDVGRPREIDMPGWLKSVWSAGCMLMIVHVLLAFAFAHHWRHREAYESTARQTAEMTGLNWGGGIYFNYALVLFWVIDVALVWMSPASVRSTRYRWLLHIVYGFMMFNATFVFGPPVWKVVVPLVAVMIAVTLHRSAIEER